MMDPGKLLGNLLRAGVMLAAVVVLVGAVIYLTRHGHEHPSLQVFASEPFDLRTIGGIVAGVRQAHGRAVIQLGLLLLIATPIARVLGAALIFAGEHDWTYTVIAGVVLALLLYSLLHAA
jgi:uncharacterized membrane protein